MIVDSSALLAILFSEPEASRLSRVILQAETASCSATTILETGLVFDSRLRAGDRDEVMHLIFGLKILVVPFTATQAEIARDAFRRFGKGRHLARLNFGDCMSYALAKERGEPLLFKGDDFSKTDIEAVAY